MPALLALIPGKDWLYGLLIVGLITFGIHERNHLIAEGEAHELTALKVSSDKLQAAAAAAVTQTAADYANSLSTVKENLDAQLQTADAQHESDALRLRDYDTYRREHPALGSATGGSGNLVQGSASTGADELKFTSLEQVALDLANSSRELSAALTACVIERDGLTGK